MSEAQPMSRRTFLRRCLGAGLVLVTAGAGSLGYAYAAPCAHELAALRAPLGVYAIPGNHDYPFATRRTRYTPVAESA